MRHIILGVLIFTSLLAGAALLGAYALPWLMSAQQVPGPELYLPASNSTSAPQDMNALVRPALHFLLSHLPRLHHVLQFSRYLIKPEMQAYVGAAANQLMLQELQSP